jgi:two-component system, chemotaxis family, chemotaxis protein CheY
MTMPLNVMIVDDSVIMVQKLSLLLRGLGHEVVRVCNNGTEAIQAYPICKPHLVTMDITMPEMDGITAMTAILGENPHARVIMVTSHGQEAMVVRALDAGALGYVLKPVTLDGLEKAIERAMSRNTSQETALL